MSHGFISERQKGDPAKFPAAWVWAELQMCSDQLLTDPGRSEVNGHWHTSVVSVVVCPLKSEQWILYLM